MKILVSTRVWCWWALAAFLAAGSVSAQSPALAWDSRVKEVVSAAGETNVTMVFSVTNISETRVAILTAKPSCGCTVMKLPSTPWYLQPGASGQLTAEIDLSGKTGLLVKSILVETSAGPQVLLTRVNIGGESFSGTAARARQNNVLIAQVNRQMVFRGDCARCHVTPGVEKTGRSLYVAACGICHDAENRATMVPDLRNLKHPTDREYWATWIKHGKAGTLMPGFAAAEGGPLSEAQIQSLVDLLAKGVPAPVPVRESK